MTPALVPALGLGLLAYWPLVAKALELPGVVQLETWLFRPSQLPLVFVLATAGWLAWSRRNLLRGGAGAPRPAWGAVGALVAAALFAWAQLTRETALLLISLAVAALAFGAAARGAVGLRALGAPALVLLLGVPIPGPLRHELVWKLQLAAAAGAGWLLDVAGFAFERSGVILRDGERTFHVIDGCSGLQGMGILLLGAIAVRELLPGSASRTRWLLLAAPLLGWALNALRVAVIAAFSEPETLLRTEAGGHTAQGLGVLAAGTMLLYALGRALAGPDADAPRERTTAPLPRWLARASASGLAALAALSLVLPTFEETQSQGMPGVAMPEATAEWRSEALSADPYFIGVFPQGQTRYRLYERPEDAPAPRRVEFFAALDWRGEIDAGHLFSTKLRRPGADWRLVRSDRVPQETLGREIELSVSAPAGGGNQRALTYLWRLHDRGLARESLRALFALDSSPLRRERPRAVVRLVAYSLASDKRALARTKARLDRFVADFAEPLSGL